MRPSAARLWAQAFEAERGRLFLWSPVCLGLGIALYFSLAQEPSLAVCAAPLLVAALVFALTPRGSLSAITAGALLLVSFGLLTAKARVESVAAPVLARQLTNVEITGRIERVEARAPRGQRLTIAVESVAGLAPDATPVRVRVRTMRDAPAGEARPASGQRVRFKATLAPPAIPALPGGFDFARAAYFERLGGVGYTFARVTVLPETRDAHDGRFKFGTLVESVREALDTRIRQALTGESGAIASALITGERGGISQATNDAYRSAGLFHILSISGLHMVVMAGAVFYCVRFVLAAIAPIALRFDIKKWAAVAGIIGALAYLAISGGAFATVRAAVQIIIMFCAVLLDRPALALRNVAVAAFVILLVYPESLFDPGFQMSFAAVAALIAAYEEVRRRFSDHSTSHPVLGVLTFFGGIVLSTLIASLAVAPFAAYHFHQSQQYAIFANLLAIPISNFVVMPAALAALLVMPLGLEAPALLVMGLGIDAMTWCARIVAQLPGAVGHLPAMPQAAFALLTAGGLWLILWGSRVRLLGAAIAGAGLVLAPTLPRPDVLVSRGGELVAVRDASGALSALPARRAKFELTRWLEHDGDARSPAEAARAAAFKCDSVGCVARVKGLALSVLRHPAALADDCAAGDVLVLNIPRPKTGCARPRRIIDVFDVWREGTHALYVDEAQRDSAGGPTAPHLRVETVAGVRGDRPWSHPPDLPRILPKGGRDTKVRRDATGLGAASSGDRGGPHARDAGRAQDAGPGQASSGIATTPRSRTAQGHSAVDRLEWGPPRAEIEDDDPEAFTDAEEPPPEAREAPTPGPTTTDEPP